ncbi:aspartic peptidase domain-containing protein [Boletus edulis BED1]|uniref:Aspartic peptidase domain-containing protein n=1 Tax=Boletus edulis BED1 TaxID=1328754 RepID=A0AAD4BLW8_BOLED|nr:aspartic peptidase domain-containing protein [Boletus edulis BED1]
MSKGMSPLTWSISAPTLQTATEWTLITDWLLIDTGSANTWLGEDFFIRRYGSGNVTGKVWNDTVSFSPSLIVSQQAIGVANSSNGFDGLDGILGVGPTDLTNRTVPGVDRIPTVMDNFFSQGTISEESLGIYFIPAPETTKKGEPTFGGYDDSVIVGPVTYVPLTKTPRSSLYWGITQTISYGSDIILPLASGLVDTGTTLIYIASGASYIDAARPILTTDSPPADAYEQYKNKTGATYDPATQLLKITAEQYDCLKPLVFNIEDAAYELTANAQIWPRSLNSLINGTSDGIYLVVSDLGPFNFTGVNFITGYTFLVYDTTHGAVGFAKTQYTYADVN